MLIELSQFDSPVGRLTVAVAEPGVLALEFTEDDAAVRSRLARAVPGATFGTNGRAAAVVATLRAYFDGNVRAIDELPVQAHGTAFQKRVWAALRNIPAGKTASYRDVAEAIGSPASVRAVGAANGQNPIALIVPCHRVIASDGTLCGYGGGLWRKEWLLRHEGALLAWS
jgi:methylated-DNA-[protein]-cysteine S-methyltransferase